MSGVELPSAMYLSAALLLIATPGQDMMLVMSRALTQGVAAGLCVALGIALGLLGHTVLAALGLGLVLTQSAALFLALKLVGAAYLVVLGLGMLRAPAGPGVAGATDLAAPGPARPVAPSGSLWRAVRDGALSNLLNPKIAIFFLAFLPQFVAPTAARPTLTLVILGLVYAALALLVKAGVALTAAALADPLRRRPQWLGRLQRGSGALLILLGLRLAVSSRD